MYELTPEEVSANAQRINTSVLILRNDEYQNTIGMIYGYLPGRKHPWLIRPHDWPHTAPGICYTEHEIEFDPTIITVRVECETCGTLFEPEHGYHDVDFSFCGDCCHSNAVSAPPR